MKVQAVAVLAVAFVVTTGFLALASPGMAQETPPVPAGGGKEEVDLELSFQIPQADKKAISHTPAVVFTKDGKRMITATSDREVVIFEVATRKLLKRIRFPEEATDSVSIDASGRYTVWGLKKGGLAVLELDSEKIVARDDKLTVRGIAVAPDGKTAAVSRGKDVEIREMPGLGLVLQVPGHSGEVNHLTWSADGRLLASTAEDGRLLVYDVPAKKKVYEVKKAQALYAAAFHPGGGFVAYGGKENTIYQYDFAAEREEVIARGQPYWITCLGYSPDGEMLAAGDESCDIWLFKVKAKSMVFHNKHHVECWLNGVAWAPDNGTFLFGCRPNGHAGKPALWAANARAEAGRSQAARQSREKLVKALDDRLAQEKDEAGKKSLQAYRDSVAQEEKLGGPQGYQAVLAYEGQFQSANNVFGVRASRRTPVNLPPEIQKLAQEHEATVNKEVEALNRNFCVNQWGVRR